MAAGLSSAACIIPPDLEPEEALSDAGPSSPPVILSAQPAEFAFPGPIVFQRPDERVLALEVEDNDILDAIFVRLYVDYNRPPTNAPTPPWADCQHPGGTRTRIIDCPVNALCTPIDQNDSTNHVLEALVSDRPFILDSDPVAEGQPPFRATADPAGAAKTIASWLMQCQPGESL